jgi:hypothetical protein
MQETEYGETVVHLLAGMPCHNSVLVDRILKREGLRSDALELRYR